MIVVARDEYLRLKDDPQQAPAGRYAAAGIEGNEFECVEHLGGSKPFAATRLDPTGAFI